MDVTGALFKFPITNYKFNMTRAPSICGVILAAGESSRMGRDKALLPWRGATFLAAAIELFQRHSELVIVVAGKNAERLRPVVDSAGAFLVVNAAPENGQFSSLRVGLQEVLNRGRDAALITLVDRPPALPSTIEKLCQEFMKDANAWAVVPEVTGRHGHPIMVGREMITAFLRAPAAATARDVEHQHHDRIRYLPVDDPAVIANVDTPEDYNRLVTA